MKRDFQIMGKFARIVCGAILTLLPILSGASGILYKFNTPFPTDPSPSGATPWLTADFENANNGVLLTISGAGLQGTEFASEVYFNLAANLNPANLNFNKTASTGTFFTPTIDHASQDAYKADGDGKYDFRFNFVTTGNGKTFTSGDSITYLISGISGLVANNFAFLSTPAGGSGPFYAAAQIQSVPNCSSGITWIEPSGGPTTTPVPEPSAVALFSFAFFLLVAIKRFAGKFWLVTIVGSMRRLRND